MSRTKNRQARRVAAAYTSVRAALARAAAVAESVAHGFDFDEPTRRWRSELIDALNLAEERLEKARAEAEKLADTEGRR